VTSINKREASLMVDKMIDEENELTDDEKVLSFD